ncbi:MAG: radical SAM family heme chaperone HemW [Selenomonadales bacterium]|nr:radical SAM family heme chaperone HemW [Selenomonadales bacterium]
MISRGLYLHVPLCVSKCLYCDFYSLPLAADVAAKYLEAVVQEIRLKGELWGGPVQTVYFGGGTPSCLSLTQVANILGECGRFFTQSPDCEVTFEVNPATADLDYLRALAALGVTRLSIGLQSATPTRLMALGRSHTCEDFFRLVRESQAAGFGNFSVDAMYGLPGQTTGEYLETLETIVNTGAPHVSVYSLQVEPNTPLAGQVASGQVALPTDDAVADMMLAGREYLLAQGFLHYELSNFARAGYESAHNTIYWRNEEYIGLGPGAASYIAGRRLSNVPNLDDYAHTLGRGRLPVHYCEHLPVARQMGETMMLGLRMLQEGVSRERFAARFGCDPVEVYSPVIARFVRQGMLEVTTRSVRLTAAGFPLASQIQMQFLDSFPT